MGTSAILAAIDEEIARLQQVKQLLGGGSSVGSGLFKAKLGHGTGNGLTPRKKHVLSPEARKRIVDAQRKRWASYKNAAKISKP